MKVGSSKQNEQVRARAERSKPNERLGNLLDDLRNAKTLETVGASVKSINQALTKFEVGGEASPTQTFDKIGHAFCGAMKQKPGGVRDLLAARASDELKLFCGEATPAGVTTLAKNLGIAVGQKDFQLFSTGDPFVFLGTPPNKQAGIKAQAEDVKNKTVLVVQGSSSYTPASGQPKFDGPTLLAEALQIAFAAKENGARAAVVVLPESLNPATHPNDPFARLAATLAKATGVDEVVYQAALDRAPAPKGVRSGLDVLGPKTAEIDKWLQTLDGATNLNAVSRSLKQLDIALTGLKGQYSSVTESLARQVADSLTSKVQQLVGGLPGGDVRADADRTIVFAGQSNPDLSRDVAHALNGDIGRHTHQFEGGAVFTQIEEQVAGRPVAVVQTTKQDPHTAPEDRHSAMAMLAEALMICTQAKEAGASDITLILPYMPNARSDKQDQKGVGTYAAMVARWIDELQLGKLVLVEPHDIHVPAFFRTPTRVISGAELLCTQVLQTIGRENLVMVRPDEGATKRTKALAEELDLPVVDGLKSRDDNTEKANLNSLGKKSDVDGKICLVNDDEIATGGTMRQVVAALKDNGAAQVHIAVSHANMPDDVHKREDSIRKLKDAGADSLYLLDTQPVGRLPDDLNSFVKIVSVAAAVADEVRP
jgi:ribose-phosphate pyrophosphokinase